MELNNIYLGDCFEIMKKLDDESFNMVLCDLPYGISKKTSYTINSEDGVNYKKYHSLYGKHTIDFGEWDIKDLDLKKLSSECFRLLKKSGVVVLFYDVWGMTDLKINFDNFKQHRLIQWIKNNPVPINSKINFLNNAIEFGFTCCKEGKPTFNTKYHNGIFKYPICHGKERTKHPTQKPVKLFNELIQIYSNENDNILDCCAGSFTTAISCLETKRNYVCIDNNEEYFNIGLQRIENFKENNKFKNNKLF